MHAYMYELFLTATAMHIFCKMLNYVHVVFSDKNHQKFTWKMEDEYVLCYHIHRVFR